MKLFDEASTTLYIGEDSIIRSCEDSLLSISNRDSLLKMVSELMRTVPGPYRIVRNGKEVRDPERYIPPKNGKEYKILDAARFVAVFLHDRENMSLYWSRVPQIYKDMVTLFVKQGYIAVEDAKLYGFDDIMTIVKPKYSYDYPEVVMDAHGAWFTTVMSVKDNGRPWEKMPYFGLRPEFAVHAATSLGLRLRATPAELKPEWKTSCAEAEALSSVPIIVATLKQGTLKFSSTRVTAASSWKFMKSLPIKEILPDFTDYGDKINCGQSFLPLFYGMPEKTLSGTPVKVLTAAAEKLLKMDEDFLVPMLMPHIKGFKASTLYSRDLNCRIALVEYFKEAKAGDWIALDPLINWLSVNNFTFLSNGILSEMPLEDPIYGGRVTLDRVTAFDRSIIGSLCTALYCLGMVEVALAPLPEVCYDPYSHVCAVRLTDLGRYALGLSKEYATPEVKLGPLFELDENRLIIRSLHPGNPYESLLPDTSVSIGGGRFLMSPESFLKNCKTKRDVEDKVAFFRQYICANPPGVWNDFFKTIERRCNPLSFPEEDFYIYVVESSDTYLLGLLASDSVLKDIVVRAEGYRILVPSPRHDAFVKRLKSFGYLV